MKGPKIKELVAFKELRGQPQLEGEERQGDDVQGPDTRGLAG